MGGDKKEREAFPSRPPAPPSPGPRLAARWGRRLPERSRGRTCPGPAVPSGELPPPATEKPAGPGHPQAPRWPPPVLAGPTPDPGDRRVCRGQRPAPGTPGGTTSFPPPPQPRASSSRCGAFPAPASPPAAESRGWGAVSLGGPYLLGGGAPTPAYQVQPSSGAGALQSTKGCFPQHGESPPPATQCLGDAAALAWARGGNWPWQVCACLAQLCCRKVKGWAAEQMRMGYRKGLLPA